MKFVEKNRIGAEKLKEILAPEARAVKERRKRIAQRNDVKGKEVMGHKAEQPTTKGHLLRPQSPLLGGTPLSKEEEFRHLKPN